MSTYALIHGGGGSAWDWHLVEPELHRRGHDTVAVDLPSEDEDADLDDYADTVLEAVGDRDDLVVVSHSLGGFTGPLVAVRADAALSILVTAMIPAPGESALQWWEASGFAAATRDTGRDEHELFYHDVPGELVVEATRRARDQAERAMSQPWPLSTWPSTPTRFVLCTEDRFFPPDFMRDHVRERLGIVPDELESGHYAPIAHPVELAELLHSYVAAD